MIVYGSSVSPFVRKVLVFAAEKGIAVETRNTGLNSDDPEFLAASPFRKIPGFSDGDYRLSDSSAIVAYLDALKPDPPLIPTEPKARGKAIWYDEFADTILFGCLVKSFFNRVVGPIFLKRPGDLAVAEKAEREELPPLIDYIESVLPDSGYLVADRLTLADIAVASPLANMRYLGLKMDPATHPRTAAFATRMHALPSFATWIAKEEAMLAKVGVVV